MSIKINALLPAAAAAAGVTTTAAAALSDGLLTTKAIKALHCAEVADGSGKVMVFATVTDGETDTVRPIAGSDGNIKLYSNANSALKLTKLTNLLPGAVVNFVPYEKPASVGDPLEGLKTRYKVACGKGFAAVSKYDQLEAKIQNAQLFGWHESTGATLAEYNDLQARLQVLDEWRNTALALVDTLEGRLNDAGVNPTSVVSNRPQMPG